MTFVGFMTCAPVNADVERRHPDGCRQGSKSMGLLKDMCDTRWNKHEKVSFHDNVRHACVIGDLEAGLASNPVLQKRTFHAVMTGKWR